MPDAAVFARTTSLIQPHGATTSVSVSDDDARIQRDFVFAYLSRSYWAEGRSRETFDRSLDHSLNFGLYLEPSGEQVAFARFITDRATFAYLCDVFVIEAHQGRGFAKHMLEVALEHPYLQNLRFISLGTRDAHGLYERLGFTRPAAPERLMERRRPNH